MIRVTNNNVNEIKLDSELSNVYSTKPVFKGMERISYEDKTETNWGAFSHKLLSRYNPAVSIYSKWEGMEDNHPYRYSKVLNGPRPGSGRKELLNEIMNPV